MKKKRIFWPHPNICDKYEAQEYLDGMEAKGYSLHSVFCGIATFIKTEPRKRKYSIDYFIGSIHEENVYLQMCDDIGWEKVTEDASTAFYFRSKDGIDEPTPIHTDTEIEQENYKRTAPAPIFPWQIDLLLSLTIIVLTIIALIMRGLGEFLSIYVFSFRGLLFFFIPASIFIFMLLKRKSKIKMNENCNPIIRYEITLLTNLLRGLFSYIIFFNCVDFIFRTTMGWGWF